MPRGRRPCLNPGDCTALPHRVCFRCYPVSDAHRMAMSAALRGRELPPEHVEAIREGKRRRREREATQ